MGSSQWVLKALSRLRHSAAIFAVELLDPHVRMAREDCRAVTVGFIELQSVAAGIIPAQCPGCAKAPETRVGSPSRRNRSLLLVPLNTFSQVNFSRTYPLSQATINTHKSRMQNADIPFSLH
jgi:hypothetical protein